MCGFVLLALGVWTVNDKLFVDELLRNKLYTETTFIIIVTSNLMILLSVFGCFAAIKEVKCLLLTYAVFMLLLLVILSVGGVLAYIFREQVENTIKAEMIADIRNYDPSQPDSSVTRAWDQTQSRLECCGLMTEQVRTGDTDMLTSVGLCQSASDNLRQPLTASLPQVSEAWQMWRYNKLLNPGPDSQLVPASCCLPDRDCRQDNITLSLYIWQGDCMTLSLQYVRQHAAILGIANVTVCFFLVRQ